MLPVRARGYAETISENTSLNRQAGGSDAVTTYFFPHGIRQSHHRINRPE
jgi:hypothetical protein